MTEAVQSEEWLRHLVADAAAAGSPAARSAAVSVVSAELVETLIHAGFDGSPTELTVAGTGTAASPGAASGSVCLSSEQVMDTADRDQAAILFCVETSPADEPAMRLADGIVTARGGMASHAAVVARGWGIPAVVGVDDLEVGTDYVLLGGHRLNPGDDVSIDGSTGEVLVGYAEVSVAEDIPELTTLLDWADEIRAGRVGVRANADTAVDAERARTFGAEGIGLCRTEHMFLGDRLPVIQRFIAADGGPDETDALEELAKTQRADLASVIAAMTPHPVTVRLLDAPLHEFSGGSVGAEWAEHNPMLGTRGVRLAVLREGLYRMQARAILGALADVRAAGAAPHAEIMIPLVADPAELALVRSWVDEEVDASTESTLVGTMIETPRAALAAGLVAAHADFFSFGTNDLTQLVFGFSRDDIERRIMSRYLELGILDANPFETLDETVVSPLVASAIGASRAVRTGLQVGVCGEHGGDPKSIRLLVGAGVDYVSCSPFRVPVARLAVAQALLEN
ncbi:MAG: putative PEP-binding protein [Actinomycetota bacterium]|nr:putative PEP-binding protein [Actinomycetota bacterium]